MKAKDLTDGKSYAVRVPGGTLYMRLIDKALTNGRVLMFSRGPRGLGGSNVKIRPQQILDIAPIQRRA